MRKNKYLVSLYRDENFFIVAAFTTSQNRCGFHFEANDPIGRTLDGTDDFSFPLRTTITFDYGLIENNQWDLCRKMENPKVVGVLNEEVFLDLIYKMYTSDYSPERYKKYYEKVLHSISK